MTENQRIISHYQYPEPGSNRHGLLHRCLRPTRLPIPPSGLILILAQGMPASFCDAKLIHFLGISKFIVERNGGTMLL